MSEWTEQEVQAAFQEIAKRAEASREFRARALEDAGAVMREVSGKDLPNSVSLQFVELENGEFAVSLQAANAGAEFSDEELEDVAGGITINNAGAMSVTSGGLCGVGALIDRWKSCSPLVAPAK